MTNAAIDTAHALGLKLPANLVALDALADRLGAVQWGTEATDPAEVLRTEYQAGALADLDAADLAGHIAAAVLAADAQRAARPLATWLRGIVATDTAQALAAHADDLLMQCQPIHAAAVEAVDAATTAGTTIDLVPTTAAEVRAVSDLAAAHATLSRVRELMGSLGKGGVGRFVDIDCLRSIGVLRADAISAWSPLEQIAAGLPDVGAKVRPRLNTDAELAELVAADRAMLARASAGTPTMDGVERAVIAREIALSGTPAA